MNNLLTIIKKEFSRFFKDKRLFFTTVLMPGLLIYCIYSFMGNTMTSAFSGDENEKSSVCVVNMPEEIKQPLYQIDVDYYDGLTSDMDSYKQQIKNEALDLLIVFPENFDELVTEYDISSGEAAPNIEIYYNSTAMTSGNLFNNYVTFLDNFEATKANKFDINRDITNFDLYEQDDMMSKMLSMILPMLLLAMMFSGCMAIAPESIAGEKERGTIATLLVTPIKRSELAVGKILSLSGMALLSGTSSFLGVMLSLPKLLGNDFGNVSTSIYSISDYLLLFLIIISTVLLLISFISILSAFAKTVKEATTIISPLMLVVILVGVSSMIGSVKTDFYWFLIPIYNSVQCMSGIFSFNFSLTNILITSVSNVIYATLFGVVLTNLFKSEKVMFSK